MTTAAALRPERATPLTAIPSRVEHAAPSSVTAVNTPQRRASVSSGRSKNTAAGTSRSTSCAAVTAVTCAILPTKYAETGIGSPRSRLSVPSSRSWAMPIAGAWNAAVMIPMATIPAVKTWLTVAPVSS